VIKVGVNAAPQRSLLNALGLTEEEMKKPLIGIAGPGGGSEKFPVGLVYIGYKINDFVKVIRYVFPGDRSEVRMHAVETALQELDDLLIKEGF
ncbi:MAG: hypothetical protein EGR89_03570, partial [[Eubacterium] rectale]|nr:hypothetical protein [Agathobacter rectalis]